MTPPSAEGKPGPLPVAIIILAAGLSSRMAPRNKLLVRDAGGVPMLARVVDAALASRASRVGLVLGHQAAEARAALGARPVAITIAEDFTAGMSASLRAGLAALPPGTEAALICLADMPLVGTPLLDRLMGAYAPECGRLVVVPACGGRRGNPVLWDARFFPAMLRLQGDSGARTLLRAAAEWVFEMEVEDEAVLRDFDTVADFEAGGGGPGD